MLKRTGRSGFSLVELLITVALVGLMVSAVAGVYQISQESYARVSSLEAAQLGARAGVDRMANELRLIGSYWVGASCVETNCNAITAASSNSITFRANVDDFSIIGGAEARVRDGSTATGATVPLNIAATAINNAFKCYSKSTLNDYIYIANGGTREVRRIATITNNPTCNNSSDRTITLASGLGSPYPAGSLVRDVKTITYVLNGTTLTRSQGGSGADPFINNVSGLTFTYFRFDGATTTTDPALIREIHIDLTVLGPDGSPRRMITRVKPRNLP